MESLREENHKLLLKLDSLKKEHSTELEFVKEEGEIREREIRAENAKLTVEYKNRDALRNEKINALNDEISVLREENEVQGAELERMRIAVEVMKHAKTGGVVNNYADYEGLKESNKMLKNQVHEKEELIEKYSTRSFELDQQVNELKRVVGGLTEEIESKDGCIKELNANIRDTVAFKDEQVLVLQNEVLAFKEQIKGINSGARGNSLFFEVEERRIKVENELTRLRNMVKKLTEENIALQAELLRGDSQTGFISTQLDIITKNENEIQAEFKKLTSESHQLFDGYRDRLELLRSEYTVKLQQYRSHSDSTSDLEKVRSERDGLLLYKMEMEREKTDLKRELKYNKHLRSNAECNVKMLKSELDRLKTTKTDVEIDDKEQECKQECSNQ